MTTSSDRGDLPRTPPGPVVVSFWILIVSAALRVLIAVLTLTQYDAIVAAQLHPLPKGMTVAQATQAIHTYLTANLILDLVFAGLYVLFAFLVRAGHNWARLTVTGVIVVFGLFALLNSTTSGTDIVTVLSVLIELVAVALLYLPNSKPYFAPGSAARTP